MTNAEALAALDVAIAAAPPEERPGLVVQLAARLAALGAGMATTAGNGHEAAKVWIKPEQAAKIAGIEVRTLYDWAAGKAWASRKTSRCLRIDEVGFRSWLAQPR